MERSGAQIVLECLREQGVDTVFGYPGGTILDIYDALIDYPDIHHYLTAHEQGASHAADGYARSTGKVGVCFATSGPGATNLTTGIATAFLDSSPVVFVTCNVEERLIGKDAFQEVDITGISMPITKWNYVVTSVRCLADVIREAFAIARTGRPGPVLVDIAKNVTTQVAEYEPLPREKHHGSGRLAAIARRSGHALAAPEPDISDIERLARMIERSVRPLVICGGGVVRGRAHREFEEFATKVDGPVAITLMGAGGYRGRNPLATGMIGMHGSLASNIAVENCDLLIAVGCRFSDRVAPDPDSFAHQALIAQIDIDRSEINKNVLVDHHIIGDAATVLRELNARLTPQHHERWKELVFSYPIDTEYEEGGAHLTPAQISDTIARTCPIDAIVATDVGQHQIWVAQHFHYEYPGQLLSSGGFGTMGFGLGAAIGAKVAHPEKCVIHITGDGSFRMNSNELATEVAYGLPIITIIYDNAALGMVRQWQTLMYHERYSQTTLDRGPDFVKLAEAYGLVGTRVSSAEEFEAALVDALGRAEREGRGSVIDCSIDRDETVRPMVPNGWGITDFLAV